MTQIQEETAYCVTIYVAGDLRDVKKACQEWAFDVGACVTVTPTTFVYTGGREEGAAVGLVNYPRFRRIRADIWERACDLGWYLVEHLGQMSVLIQDPEKAKWITRRESA